MGTHEYEGKKPEVKGKRIPPPPPLSSTTLCRINFDFAAILKLNKNRCHACLNWVDKQMFIQVISGRSVTSGP